MIGRVLLRLFGSCRGGSCTDAFALGYATPRTTDRWTPPKAANTEEAISTLSARYDSADSADSNRSAGGDTFCRGTSEWPLPCFRRTLPVRRSRGPRNGGVASIAEDANGKH